MCLQSSGSNDPLCNDVLRTEREKKVCERGRKAKSVKSIESFWFILC